MSVRHVQKYAVLQRLAIFALASLAVFAEEKPLTIGWANLQWPPATNHVISVTNPTPNIYGQVWIDGVTSQPGAAPKLMAQLGFGPAGSNPLTNKKWQWVDARFNLDVGNNDEFMANLLPEAPGVYDYLYRYSTTGGSNWLYADLKGPLPAITNGLPLASAGKLTVQAGEDTKPPAMPKSLTVESASPSEVRLSWAKVTGDPTLYGYEVLRSLFAGGPYTNLARITTNLFVDATVTRGKTYYYVVRSVDQSFNRSPNSPEIRVEAERSVTVTFNVAVPASTASVGKPLCLAGTLTGLNGSFFDWDPGALKMTRIDATHWTIALNGKEGTKVNYKYTLESWDNVEKGAQCDEISDRRVTLTGSKGAQTVNDIVPNWRNIAPCKD